MEIKHSSQYNFERQTVIRELILELRDFIFYRIETKEHRRVFIVSS